MPLVASENYKLALSTITDQNSGLIQRFTDIRLHSYNLDTQDFTSAWNPATDTHTLTKYGQQPITEGRINNSQQPSLSKLSNKVCAMTGISDCLTLSTV